MNTVSGGTANGIYDDFPGYRVASGAQLDTAVESATVVVDTNVLLNLYRYNSATRDDLLDVLERIGDRLWVPHQVLREFWRNRLSVLAGRNAATDQALAAFEKQRRATTDTVATWARTAAVSPDLVDQMIGLVDGLHDRFRSLVSDQSPAEAELSGGAMEETVLRRLEAVLDGKVGPEPAPEEWGEMLAEGKRRVAARQPPGYLDAEKSESALPEGAAGDYLVWAEALKEVARRGGDLLLVTGDVKEDWWWRYRSEALGPRHELVDELWRLCGAHVFFLRPIDLLRRGRILHVAVREESLDDAERVDRRIPVGRWTPAGVDALLQRLESEGWEHALVIREAAAAGGRIERAEVYRICGYDDDRMLRGFSRPPSRVTRDLQLQGVVADDVDPPLTAVYEGGVKAVAFVVPDEFTDHLSVADDDATEMA